MKLILREDYDPAWIDQMLDLYNSTELKRPDREKVERAFANSFAVATCWTDQRLIGIGRMISDGEMYSGIFDVVVAPEFQKQGIGKKIMDSLIAKAPHTFIHLTSTFGNEPFYFKLGFKPHKTSMALFPAGLSGSPYLDHDWEPS